MTSAAMVVNPLPPRVVNYAKQPEGTERNNKAGRRPSDMLARTTGETTPGRVREADNYLRDWRPLITDSVSETDVDEVHTLEQNKFKSQEDSM